MVIVQSREDWILFLLQILPTIYQGKEINSSLYVNLKYLRVFLGSASSGIPIVSYVGIPLEQPHWIPFFPAFIIFGGENAYFLMLTLKLICNAYVQEGNDLKQARPVPVNIEEQSLPSKIFSLEIGFSLPVSNENISFYFKKHPI